MTSGEMAYSDNNGITWTKILSGTGAGNSTFYYNNGIRSIAYGNSKWVAVGDGGRMAYFTNGTTWTAVTDSTFGTSNNAINTIGIPFAKCGRSRLCSFGCEWITHHIAYRCSCRLFNTV